MFYVVNIKGVIGNRGGRVTLESIADQMYDDATCVYFVIDSIGGDVWEGFLIHEFIQVLNQNSVETVAIVQKNCCSIATYVALACQKRIMHPESVFMIHKPHLTQNIDCESNICTVDFIEGYYEALQETTDKLKELYQSETIIEQDVINMLMEEERYMGENEAVQYGFMTENYTSFLEGVNKDATKYAGDKKLFLKKMFGKNYPIENMQKPILQRVTEYIKGITNRFVKLGAQASIENIATLELQDGTKIFVDVAEGESLMSKVATLENGDFAPAGIHTLIDGTQIEIGENGVISAIIEAMKQAEPPVPTPAPSAQEAKATVDANKIAQDLVAQLMALSQRPKPELNNMGKNAGKPSHKLDGVAEHLKSRKKIGYTPRPEIEASAVVPNFTQTWNGRWTTETFFEPVLRAASIADYAYIMTDVPGKTNLNIAGRFGKVIKKKTACGTKTATNENQAEIEERTLVCEAGEIHIVQCVDEFLQTVYELALKLGMNFVDITGTELDTILQTILKNDLQLNITANVWMSDSADLDAYYNIGDGWLKILLAEALAGDVVKTADIAVLNNVAGTTGYDYLKRLWEESTNELDQIPENEKIFVISRKWYENFTEKLENTGNDMAWVMLQDGKKQLQFRGVPVLKESMFDQEFARPTNPYNGLYNIFGMLTWKENLVAGLADSALQSDFKVFFDEKTDETIYKGAIRMGQQIKHGSMTTFTVGLI